MPLPGMLPGHVTVPPRRAAMPPGARTPGAAAPGRAAQAPDLPTVTQPRVSGPVPRERNARQARSSAHRRTAADPHMYSHDVLYCALRYKHSTIHNAYVKTGSRAPLATERPRIDAG